MPRQRLAVQVQLGHNVHQLAFLLAQIPAPHNGQQLILGDAVAKQDRTRTVARLANLDHFAGKAAADLLQVSGIQR